MQSYSQNVNYTTNGSNSNIAIGYGATASNTDDCIAIGDGATAASSNNVAIGWSATTAETLRVGDSVRFSHEEKNYTGEITTVTDGYYFIKSDSPVPGWQGDIAAVPMWMVTEIDALQRFTEATD